MVNSELFDLFPKHFVDKQVEITYSGGTITNTELFSESMEIYEILCNEKSLRFGKCSPGRFKIRIANVFIPLVGHEITVQMKLEDHHDTPFQIGKYKVTSDTPTADRRWRDIIAYDAMQWILDADVAAWYNEVLPGMDSQTTMREFRRIFLEHFGIAEADPEQELANDDMVVQRTIEPDQMSGKDVITAICEINGCFGHINREGKFAYIYLPQYIQGLYPANDLYPDHAPDYLPYQQETGHLYPQDPKGNVLGRKGTYISCKYEDFITKEIKRLQIRKEENDIGVIVNEEKSGNTYIIQNNFLVYGKGTDELKKIAENIFSKISGIIYRPYSAEIQGNPCFEVGDTIRLSTKYEIVESFVFERTLKGIQALRDSFSANGTETYGENLNSTHNSIVELRGKSNMLTRTIEETKSDLRDTEQNIRSTITQTASEIRSEVEKADEELSSTITQTASDIRTEVENTRENLQSQITQNAGEIDLRVRKDNIIADINLTPEKITIEAQKIDLKGLVNAEELVSKFATITTLNATKAELQTLIAEKATIKDLDAAKANLTSLISEKATIASLNATNARVGVLETDRITASEVSAKYATTESLQAVDAKFNNINAGNITAGTISTDRLDINGLLTQINSRSLQCVTFTASTVRGTTFQIYRNTAYTTLYLRNVKVGDTNYTLLGL